MQQLFPETPDTLPGEDEPPSARLYQEPATDIFASIPMRTATLEEAEDILLEVFLAALEHGDLLEERGIETKRTWLRSVEANKIADNYRNKNVAESLDMQ